MKLSRAIFLIIAVLYIYIGLWLVIAKPISTNTYKGPGGWQTNVVVDDLVPELHTNNGFVWQEAVITNIYPTYKIEWQYDNIRAEIKSLKEQEEFAKEFVKTNTQPNVYPNIYRRFIGEWTAKKGDKELGYRSDGVVVWREVPEGK